MPKSLTAVPRTDPAPIAEHFRGAYGTELLTAAVAEFHLFAHLAQAPITLQELREKIGLERRAANVLVTALRAMGLLHLGSDGQLKVTDIAREHLVPGA